MYLLRGETYAKLAEGFYSELKNKKTPAQTEEKQKTKTPAEEKQKTNMPTTEIPSFAENPGDLKFEFKDSFWSFEKNICYKYKDNAWYWTRDCNRVGKEATPLVSTGFYTVYKSTSWIPVTSLKNPYGGKPSQTNLDIIKGLQQKNFEQGLNYLFQNLKVNGKELSTGTTTYSSDGIFSLLINKTAPTVYFTFDKNKWYWSLRKSNGIWIPVPEVKPKDSKGHLLSQVTLDNDIQQVILALDNKDFLEGAKILFLVFENTQTKTTSNNFPTGETCKEVEPFTSVDSISNPRERVLFVANNLAGKQIPPDLKEKSPLTCWDKAAYVYEKADVVWDCAYSDGGNKNGPFYEIKDTDENNQLVNVYIPTVRSNVASCKENKPVEDLQAGDLLSIVWDVDNNDNKNGAYKAIPHNVIFIKWIDQGKRVAEIFHGYGSYYNYLNNVNLSDTSHKVFQIWEPKISTA